MPEPEENEVEGQIPPEENEELEEAKEEAAEEEEEVDEGPSLEEVAQENARLERERRKYVKRRGGFRKGLPQKAKAIAGKINKKLGKKVSDGWDVGLLQDFLPGIDHPFSTQHIEKRT